jgi:hypothetical protein
MNLQPTETELIGQWRFEGGRIIPDATCERIEYLRREVLREIARDTSGWDVLFKDPNDGRLWELTYPQSEMHGGGPPQLRCLSTHDAGMKYGDAVRPD